MPARSENAVAPAARYSAIAIALHWLIAAALLFQIALGWRMGDAEGATRAAFLQLHKSVGIAILLLSLARLAWRLAKPPPAGPPTLTRLERRLSSVVHAGFYLAIIGLPLTGWAMISTGRGATRLFGLVPWPKLPVLPSLPPAVRETVGGVFDIAHSALVWLTLALLALHVAGALKHHFLSRDTVLLRMAPGMRPGRIDLRLAAIPAAALLAFVSAGAVRGPAPARPKPASLAQADLYLDVVAPLLQQRCASCHNDDRDRGGLSVATHAALIQGGADGTSIVAGNPVRSELFRRINLSRTHEEYMPRGRVPLTPTQKAAIEVWIEVGAPAAGAKVASLRLKPSQLAILQRSVLGGAEAQGEDALPQIGQAEPLPKVAAADAAAVAALERRGFLVRRIAKGSELVSVSYTARRPLDDQDFTTLQQLAPQIRSLSLRDAGVRDERLKAIAAMPHLQRLRLEANPITDVGLPDLAALKSLTHLSLVGTKVTDAGLGALTALPKLTDVYLWGSGVTSAGLKRIEAGRPQVQFHAGVAPGEIPPGQKLAPVT